MNARTRNHPGSSDCITVIWLTFPNNVFTFMRAFDVDKGVVRCACVRRVTL